MENKLTELLEKRFLTIEEMEYIMENANYEDNGMSGQYQGYHWYTVIKEDGTEYDIYVK